MPESATNPRDRVLHALSDATRRLLLKRISSGCGSVAEISAALEMSGPAISKHLRVLEECGLIERQRAGRFHRFQLHAEPIHEAIETLTQLVSESPQTVPGTLANPAEIDVTLL
jgi:DNA-binding transcriptional ArsR family regulator